MFKGKTVMSTMLLTIALNAHAMGMPSTTPDQSVVQAPTQNDVQLVAPQATQRYEGVINKENFFLLMKVIISTSIWVLTKGML